jgi:hypothetical protein
MALLGLMGVYLGVHALFVAHPEALPRSALSWFLSSITILGTAVGLWRMRYWAFIFYAVLWLAGTAFALSVGAQFNWWSLGGPAIMVLVLVFYWRRFGANNSFQRTRYARR